MQPSTSISLQILVDFDDAFRTGLERAAVERQVLIYQKEARFVSRLQIPEVACWGVVLDGQTVEGGCAVRPAVATVVRRNGEFFAVWENLAFGRRGGAGKGLNGKGATDSEAENGALGGSVWAAFLHGSLRTVIGGPLLGEISTRIGFAIIVSPPWCLKSRERRESAAPKFRLTVF